MGCQRLFSGAVCQSLVFLYSPRPGGLLGSESKITRGRESKFFAASFFQQVQPPLPLLLLLSSLKPLLSYLRQGSQHTSLEVARTTIIFCCLVRQLVHLRHQHNRHRLDVLKIPKSFDFLTECCDDLLPGTNLILILRHSVLQAERGKLSFLPANLLLSFYYFFTLVASSVVRPISSFFFLLFF